MTDKEKTSDKVKSFAQFDVGSKLSRSKNGADDCEGGESFVGVWDADFAPNQSKLWIGFSSIEAQGHKWTRGVPFGAMRLRIGRRCNRGGEKRSDEKVCGGENEMGVQSRNFAWDQV